MLSLVEHAGHNIQLKLSEDETRLEVYCWTCEDYYKNTRGRIGSFLLKESEQVSA